MSEQATQEALFTYLLRLGDDALVLGQRLAEWCGHGPILEEDIALTNISLDCVGQAEAFLRLAGHGVGGDCRNPCGQCSAADELDAALEDQPLMECERCEKNVDVEPLPHEPVATHPGTTQN